MAALFRLVGFDPENEYYEGAVFLVAGILVLSMVLWMLRAGKHLKRDVERRVEAVASRGDGMARVAIFAFAFFMVLREGAETVLFLQAAALDDGGGPAALFGGLLGVTLAALLGALLVRGSLAINLSRFFRVTAVVLLVLAIKLLAGGVHELGERGALPLTQGLMAVIGFFVRGKSGDLLMMAIVTAPILLLLVESFSGRSRLRPADESGAAPALARGPEARRRRAAVRSERAWQGALVAVAAIVALSLTSTALASGNLVDPAPQPVTAAGGTVAIPVGSLQEDRLAKFSFLTSQGTEVRFLLARLENGAVVSSLDACSICGAIGYGQDGAVAICKNCNAPISLDSLGLGGGCNPRVLSSAVNGESIQVPAAELEAAAPYFQRD